MQVLLVERSLVPDSEPGDVILAVRHHQQGAAQPDQHAGQSSHFDKQGGQKVRSVRKKDGNYDVILTNYVIPSILTDMIS